MELGFDTIGSATVVVYDREPILATDPWVEGSAYFGSWSLSHAVPLEQRAAIDAAKFIWFSHGHPDHLNPDSLPRFRRHQILLPDHVGGRIARQLRAGGFHVKVLPHQEWVPLSERVSVLCIPDANQDAMLLINVGGRLVVNANDSRDRGSTRVRRIIQQFPVSFLLRLTGFGDGDMMNFFNDSGERLVPNPKARRDTGVLAGHLMSRQAAAFGVTHAIPFSSMHQYQRADSVWANEHLTQVDEYAQGYESTRAELLPAFIRYDVEEAAYEEIRPPRTPYTAIDPKDFGDDWGETLAADEVKLASDYFSRIEHVADYVNFINLRVGGRDNIIELSKRRFERGITFETPRASLVTAMQEEIFDDLLIGNFMRTTLHGKWPPSRLYPDFSPYVGKYADNGRAFREREVRAYFAEYRRRMAPLDYVRQELAAQVRAGIRKRWGPHTPTYRAAELAYSRVVRARPRAR